MDITSLTYYVRRGNSPHSLKEAFPMSENQAQKMREELIALGMSEEKVAAIMAEVQRQPFTETR